jgi:hypothetical protein
MKKEPYRTIKIFSFPGGIPLSLSSLTPKYYSADEAIKILCNQKHPGKLLPSANDRDSLVFWPGVQRVQAPFLKLKFSSPLAAAVFASLWQSHLKAQQ